MNVEIIPPLNEGDYILCYDSTQKGRSILGPLYIGKIGKVECKQLSVKDTIDELRIDDQFIADSYSAVKFRYMIHAFCLEDRDRFKEISGVLPKLYLDPFYIDPANIITKCDSSVETLWMHVLNEKIEEELRKDAYEEDK